MRPPPAPVQLVEQRRDAALAALVGGVPYIGFLGILFERRGDELTAVMPYREALIGNPLRPALHGGATAAFLEVAALVELGWQLLWDDIEGGRVDPAALDPSDLPRLPKTIDVTVDYLRAGLPRDAYARARVNRSGRRYASVHVEAWQDNRSRPFAQCTGHFLMPEPAAAGGEPVATGAASAGRGPASAGGPAAPGESGLAARGSGAATAGGGRAPADPGAASTGRGPAAAGRP